MEWLPSNFIDHWGKLTITLILVVVGSFIGRKIGWFGFYRDINSLIYCSPAYVNKITRTLTFYLPWYAMMITTAIIAPGIVLKIVTTLFIFMQNLIGYRRAFRHETIAMAKRKVENEGGDLQQAIVECHNLLKTLASLPR